MRSLYFNLLSFIQNIYLYFNQRNLRVLTYHTVKERENFDKQLKFLKRNYSLIDLSILKDHVLHHKQLPIKPLLITFDDGDISVLNIGLPILKKHGASAVLFVITDLINTNKPFWWDEITHFLGPKDGNPKVWEVKTWKNKRREQYLTDLRSANKDNLIFKDQLSSSQLRELQDGGVIIANHSHTHPMFDRCEGGEIKKELENSQSILRQLEFHSDVFAFPNGNYDEVSEQILKEKNIKLAFLFDHKINPLNINPLRISRIRVNSDTELKEFKVKVSGLHSLIYNRIK